MPRVAAHDKAAAVIRTLQSSHTLARSVSMCRRSMCSDRSPVSICLSCCSCSTVHRAKSALSQEKITEVVVPTICQRFHGVEADAHLRL